MASRRFRVNILRQRGSVAMVNPTYQVRDTLRSKALNLALKLQEIGHGAARADPWVVGSTGSGNVNDAWRSMIDDRNGERSGHILTIEVRSSSCKPQESIVGIQREIGLDTQSLFQLALKNCDARATGRDLDRRIRDRETMQHCGGPICRNWSPVPVHLCMPLTPTRRFDRIINSFRIGSPPAYIVDLSLHLQAIVSQRLIPARDGSASRP